MSICDDDGYDTGISTGQRIAVTKLVDAGLDALITLIELMHPEKPDLVVITDQAAFDKMRHDLIYGALAVVNDEPDAGVSLVEKINGYMRDILR